MMMIMIMMIIMMIMIRMMTMMMVMMMIIMMIMMIIMIMIMIMMLMMIVSCCRPTYQQWYPLEVPCPHAVVCHRFAAAHPAHGAQSQPQGPSGEGEQLLYKLGATVSVNVNKLFFVGYVKSFVLKEKVTLLKYFCFEI